MTLLCVLYYGREPLYPVRPTFPYYRSSFQRLRQEDGADGRRGKSHSTTATRIAFKSKSVLELRNLGAVPAPATILYLDNIDLQDNQHLTLSTQHRLVLHIDQVRVPEAILVHIVRHRIQTEARLVAP